MSDTPWLIRYFSKATSGRQPTRANWQGLRQLERRRVLAADITGITINPDPTVEGDMVTVSATATGTGPLEFDWMVTRDSTPIADSFTSSVNFTALEDGVYLVHLIVTDQADQISDSLRFEIVVQNGLPEIMVAGPQDNLPEGSLLDMTGVGERPFLATFTDPGVFDSHSATVDWGDGTIEAATIVALDGSYGVAGSHTYADNGLYTVTITVHDDGGMATGSFTVDVVNVDPKLTVPQGPLEVAEGSLLSIPNLGLISDSGYDNPDRPGGASFETFTYTIDWGDGSVDQGSATIDQIGSERIPTLASFAGSHIYADNGLYTVTVTVHDDDQGMDTGTFQVNVSNVDPVLTLPQGPLTVAEGSLLSIPDLGSISDPGFDNPGRPGGASFETFTYSIDWGDGSTIEHGTATIDQIGAGGLPTLASFAGSHIYADNGLYTVTVTVYDDDQGMDMGSFLVDVTNVAPMLVVPQGHAPIAEGSLLTINNIGMIIDPGFDNPDRPVGASFETFTYSIDWGDGSALDMGTATIDQIGSNGVPTLASFDGAHVYADNGTYTVKITVHDDDGDTAMGTFKVDVTNVAPMLTVPQGPLSTSEGSVLSIPNIGMISDPGFHNPNRPGGASFETFTYSIDWGDGSAIEMGSATIDQTGSAGIPTLASLDGSHTYADNGTYTVTVTVHDDDGGMAMGSFEVSVANVDPMLTVPQGPLSTSEGSVLSINDIGLISDPGFHNPNRPGGASFETFAYSIDWGDGSAIDMGSASIDQIGSAGSPTLASLDGSHTYADNGTYTVTITVHDDDGGMAMGSFEVNVANVAPMLTVPQGPLSTSEGSVLSIPNIGMISDPGFHNPNRPGGASFETFTYSIDWGDGTAIDQGSATIDQVGAAGLHTLASFDGNHIYADNGTYTVKITVLDDDGGMAVETFTILVHNVAPTFVGGGTYTIDEGTVFNLNDLSGGAIGLTDPGFHNPNNTLDPDNGGETSETFTGISIDWGDGHVTNDVDIVDLVSGGPGVLTTAKFEHPDHAYADNGTYMVTVTFTDDDGGITVGQLTIIVNNVAPTLTLEPSPLPIYEGQTVTIPLLGSFRDPGFDNPLNSMEPGDGREVAETFTVVIDWNDGTIEEVPLAQIMKVNGSLGNDTTGTIGTVSHKYVDNDSDNVYEVKVTLSDDDGGSITQILLITVYNVSPTLLPLSATDVDSSGMTTLTFTFSDPGADTFEVFIDWGDGVPTTPEVVYPGPTPETFVVTHVYNGPPNPDNPSADITIKVWVHDDDAKVAGVIETGVSNIETIDISQPGINTQIVTFPPPLEVGGAALPVLFEQAPTAQVPTVVNIQSQVPDIRSGGGEVAVTSDRYFVLVIVNPDGTLGDRFPLPDDVMNDLVGLFARLHDDHYRIYLVRTENQSYRLVIDVVTRDGRMTVPGDSSSGIRDRPPEAVEASQVDESDEAPLDDSTPRLRPGEFLEKLEGPGDGILPPEGGFDDQTSDMPNDSSRESSTAAMSTAALALAAVAIDPRVDWSVRLERAFASADPRRWRRLRRRRPR
jgi:PKD repeat protein